MSPSAVAKSLPLFTRHPANPIITVNQLPYQANAIFNPAAARVDGETVVLARVEDMRGISHLIATRSTDGATDWRFDADPFIAPDAAHPEELWGCEDPRITWLAELGQWAITYTAYSCNGPLVALALSPDLHSVTKHGPVTLPEDKDAALFPYRINGRWAMIHRPTPHDTANMWISYSPDLVHWGDHKVLLEARRGAWWDVKIGLGPQPIETAEGWLVCYHGVRLTSAGPIYRAGLVLLDLDDPCKVLRRTDKWVLGPAEPYELNGDVGNVVFPSGWVLDEKTGIVSLYYGAADMCIGLATAKLDGILAHLHKAPRG